MTQHRQLAAIMFSDMVGYTTQMGENEQKAFELLRLSRQIQKPVIEQFNGRLIKEIGDGVMSSFPTASDAVYAALRIQEECAFTDDLVLRIGIHLGEVVLEQNDVFGDGVNIASRIQTLTPPGSIWISEVVRNNVANKTDFITEFIKTEQLKNVKESVRIYCVKTENQKIAPSETAVRSLIPGYCYDVFISYRQKDNKGEKWVSTFVEMVRAELDSTFKEDVSIYFDENPHDGLLDTHDVNDSLKDKLKCLIFIPIISQTYCDPNAFAWQSEFLPFIDLASKDKLGLTVKLLNGNVHSRVLPVRIHELEGHDVELVETTLKGKLRPVDFIYKSPGVNRPMRHNEEDPLKNANHTLYRDQINKTANTIKDIINGIKYANTDAMTRVRSERNVLTIPGKVVDKVKSLAVLPFTVYGNNPDVYYLGDSLAEEVLNCLSLIRGLKTFPRSLSFQFRGNSFNLLEVANKLNAGLVLFGEVSDEAGYIKVIVKLNTITDSKELWSKEYSLSKDFIKIPAQIAMDVAAHVGVTVREGEQLAVQKTFTVNEAAYLEFLKARSFRMQAGEGLMKSLVHFQKAVVLDPEFSSAFTGIAEVCIMLGFYNLMPFGEAIRKSKEAALKALTQDPTLLDAFNVLAFISMCYEWNWPEGEKIFNKVFATNSNQHNAADRLRQYSSQIAAHIKEAETEPFTVPHFLKAYAFLHYGKFEEGIKAAQYSVDSEPDSFLAHRALGLSYIGLEKYTEAASALERAASLSNRHQWLLFELMGAYMLAGKLGEARFIMDEAMAGSNVLPSKIYNFFFPPVH